MWNTLGKLPDEMISNLNRYYNENEHKLKIKDIGNVKNVKCLRLNSVDDQNVLDVGFEIYNLINNKTLKPYDSYILEYYENSFTAIHHDIIGGKLTNSITTVTLLKQSNDLLGGKILVIDPKDKSIVILDQNIGEVISYDHRINHGVSKILKGNRRVLINWYNSRADDIK
jgi:hypothetical protein